MTIEEFVAQKLGVADDKKVAAVKDIKEFLDGSYVPKTRFNEVNEAKKALETTVADRDKQLEQLKASKGDKEALEAQIKKLQDDNKAARSEQDAKIKDLQISNAIKLAIADKAQDADIVSRLIDKTKLILGEDGKVTGLDDQVKALTESKPFLFKPAGGKPAYSPNGGDDGSAKNPFAKDSFNLTEQGRLYRENPEQAQAMAAEAGVTLSI